MSLDHLFSSAEYLVVEYLVVVEIVVVICKGPRPNIWNEEVWVLIRMVCGCLDRCEGMLLGCVWLLGIDVWCEMRFCDFYAVIFWFNHFVSRSLFEG